MQKLIRLMSLMLIAVLVALPQSASSHHSMSEFDRAIFTEVEGTISRISWKNPHILLEVKGADTSGTQMTWTFEGGAVSAVSRRGVQGEQLKIGDRVRLAGNPSTRRDHYIQVHHILTEAGAELLVGNIRTPRWTSNQTNQFASSTSNTPTKNIGDSLFRVWSQGIGAWFFGGPRAGYQLNNTATAKVAQWDDIADNPLSQCIGPGMPAVMGNPYPMEFVQVGRDIEIRLEEFDAVRKIHMGTNTARPAQIALSPMGYSVGRWEGKTLVVDTSRISWPYFDRAGAPQTSNVTINERFTVIQDGNRLEYVLTVNEPATLVKPFIWNAYFVWKPSEMINRYDCTNEDWASPKNTLRK